TVRPIVAVRSEKPARGGDTTMAMLAAAQSPAGCNRVSVSRGGQAPVGGVVLVDRLHVLARLGVGDRLDEQVWVGRAGGPAGRRAAAGVVGRDSPEDVAAEVLELVGHVARAERDAGGGVEQRV